MNWQMWIIIIGATAFLFLLVMLAIRAYNVWGRYLKFVPKPDAYAWIKLKNGGMVLKKGRRSKENDANSKHMTTNWLNFVGVSGTYLALPGTNDSLHLGTPCWIFIEGDANPKKFLPDGSMGNAVSAEVIRTSVRVELYTQFARKLADQLNIPMWVFIAGGVLLFVIVMGIIVYAKTKGVPVSVPVQVVG